MGYDWNFSVLADKTVIATLAKGLWKTIELTVTCILFGTPVGFLVGFLPALTGGVSWSSRVSHSSQHTRLARAFESLGISVSGFVVFIFVDVIRAIPLLLLMLTCYYGLPHVLSVFRIINSSPGTISQVSAFTSAAFAMSINLSAFIADLVRGGLDGVPRGHITAGLALGMTRSMVIRRIVLPEVVRDIWASLVLLYITMLKMSTLASAITVWELLHSAESLILNTYRVLELYLALCGVFIIIIVPLSVGARRLERSTVLRRRS